MYPALNSATRFASQSMVIMMLQICLHVELLTSQPLAPVNAIKDVAEDSTVVNKVVTHSSGAVVFLLTDSGIRRRVIGLQDQSVIQIPKDDLEGVPVDMVLSDDEALLIVVWSNGTCKTYSSETLREMQTLKRADSSYGRIYSQLLFLGEEYGGKRTVYLAISGHGDEKFRITITQHSLTNGSLLRSTVKESYDNPQRSFMRNFKYGLNYNGFSYIITEDSPAINQMDVRILRFCDYDLRNGHFNSWYETKLECQGNIQKPHRLQSIAYAGQLEATLKQSTPRLAIILNESLYHQFNESPSERELCMCNFSMKEIDDNMDTAFDDCLLEHTTQNVEWTESGSCTYTENLSKCQLKARNMFNGDYGPGLLASSNSLKSTGKVLPLNDDEIAQIGSGAFSIATRYEGRDSLFVLPRQEQAIYEYAINQNELVQIHKWYPESEDVTFIKYNANKDSLLVVHHEPFAITVLPLSSRIQSVGQTSNTSTSQPPTRYLIRQAFQSGVSVVRAVARKLRKFRSFSRSHQILRKMAYLHTKDGLTLAKTQHTGGIWNVSVRMFEKVKQISKSPTFIVKVKKIHKRFKVDWNEITYEDLDSPLNSALALCLYMESLDIPVPRKVTKQAKYWAVNIAPLLDESYNACTECAERLFLCSYCELCNVETCILASC